MGIAYSAKSDPLIGQIYLYMCVYNDYRERKIDCYRNLSIGDQYPNKTIKEICLEDIIQDFASTDILSIIRTFAYEMNLNRSSPWPDLNGYSIQTYARTWALSRNPYYLWFDINNDCTNFASQALSNGGLYRTFTSSDQTANGIVNTPTRWFYFQNNSTFGYSISTSFIRVLELYNYLAPHYSTFSTINGSTMTPYLNRGFLLQGKHFIGNYSHSVIITVVNGEARYCAHTSNRKDESMSTFYNHYYRYRVVQVY